MKTLQGSKLLSVFWDVVFFAALYMALVERNEYAENLVAFAYGLFGLFGFMALLTAMLSDTKVGKTYRATPGGVLTGGRVWRFYYNATNIAWMLIAASQGWYWAATCAAVYAIGVVAMRVSYSNRKDEELKKDEEPGRIYVQSVEYVRADLHAGAVQLVLDARVAIAELNAASEELRTQLAAKERECEGLLEYIAQFVVIDDVGDDTFVLGPIVRGEELGDSLFRHIAPPIRNEETYNPYHDNEPKQVIRRAALAEGGEG